jgi:hypothetical protein
MGLAIASAPADISSASPCDEDGKAPTESMCMKATGSRDF